ncbi:MAG: hypothetical protein ABUM51_01890, partial [Bacteroidota bacterium]
QTINRSKKIALSLVILMTLTISYSFAAAPDSMNGQIAAAFQKDFKNAKVLNTEVTRHFTKLTFKMNDIVLFAFYSDNGQLLAVTRNILSSQLPIDLMMDLKKNYSDCWITELFELNGDEQNCYYVSLESADFKIVLRSTSDNNWEVYEKKAKN